jgi:6-pyruvoyltetrahydropterin/6-carboxytetrahydropterin synthase
VYTLTIERQFAAAHVLRDYDGKCSRLHGHNYRVEISVSGQPGPNGMVLDFTVFKRVCDQVLAEFDHHLLNEVPPFDEQNPTCELICRQIYDRVAAGLESRAVRVSRVRVWETPTSSATYEPDGGDDEQQ